MDAPTFFFSLFNKGWAEFVSNNQVSSTASIRARIVPKYWTSVLTYSRKNGARYLNEPDLISDVNHAIAELCAEPRLTIPAAHIAPELSPLCHNGKFDARSLLDLICINPHIAVECISRDSYFVRCNLQLARGIPDLIGAVALLIKILRRSMSPHATGPFHMTTLYEDEPGVPRVANAVPNAQTRSRSITIPGDTTAPDAAPAVNTPARISDSEKTSPAAKGSVVPAPAPTALDEDREGKDTKQPLESLLEQQILELIAQNDDGIAISSIQISLYGFFKEQTALCLDQLEKRGVIRHTDTCGYVIASDDDESNESAEDAKGVINPQVKPEAHAEAPLPAPQSAAPAPAAAPKPQAVASAPTTTPAPQSAASIAAAAPKPLSMASAPAAAPAPAHAAAPVPLHHAETPAPITSDTRTPAQPIVQLDALSPFTFHSGALAVYFLTTLGASRDQICTILSLPESAYARFYKRGYSIFSSSLELNPNFEHDMLLCKWAKTVRRSDTRLVLQLFLGEISPESIGMRTMHGGSSTHSIDRIYDTRFDRIFDSCESYLGAHEHVRTRPQNDSTQPESSNAAPSEPSTEQPPAGTTPSIHPLETRANANQSLSNAPAPAAPANDQPTTETTPSLSFALPAHPRYLRAKPGTRAGMPGGSARPLDLWPYPFSALGDQALFLHVLGATQDEASRALGITRRTYEQLVERRLEGNPLFHHATDRTDEGRICIKPERVDLEAAWVDKDPMGFAMALTKQQRQFVCGWLVGDNEIKMSNRRHLFGANLKSIYDGIVDLQRRWSSGEPAPGHTRASSVDSRESSSGARTEPAIQLTLDLVVPSSPHTSTPAAQQASDQAPAASQPATGTITLAEWLDSLSAYNSNVVREKLAGSGFAGVAKQTGRTIREVRQEFTRTFSSRPILCEDRYQHLMRTYHVNEVRFKQLTGLGELSFSYLRHIDPQKGVKPLIPGALEDPLVPADIKQKLQKGSSPTVRDGVLIDGVVAPRRYEALLVALGKSIASQKSVTAIEFQTAYSNLLKANGLSDHILLQAPENPQSFSQSISKTDHFLVVSQKYIRYYDYDAHDFAPLVTLLRAEASKNIECSAQLIFDRHQALMEQLGLMNGRELFVVIKRLLQEHRSIDIHPVKNPLLKLGQCDRHQQVLAVIKEASPASADELASIYLERYGVSANTFKSTFLRDFHAYKKHGTYEYRDSQLNEQQVAFLRTLLTDSCHPLAVVKLRYEVAPFPTSALDINDENLRPLGYSVSHKLIVRDGVDLDRLFAQRIDEHDQFDEGDPGFEIDVIHHPAFSSELKSRIDSYAYAEFEPGRYVSTKKLNELFGISALTLKDYADQVARRAEFDIPFTVQSMRRDGFSHPADALAKDAGVKDCFYETLIETLPMSCLIKRTSFDGTKVFCKSKSAFSVPLLMSYLARREQNIEVEDLVDLLADEYGVHTTAGYVRNAIERAHQDGRVFYAQNFDAVFPDKTAYAEYLTSCINGTA